VFERGRHTEMKRESERERERERERGREGGRGGREWVRGVAFHHRRENAHL